MLTRKALAQFGVVALVAAACESDSESPDHSGPDYSQTDVIWIVVDTLRADYVFDPNRPHDLPALDALAADAIVFPNTFTHAPMTLPAHTAMFTSRHPFETGIVCNGQWGELDREFPLFGPWLAGNGYHTSAVLSMGTVGERWNEHTLFPDFDHYERDFRYMIPADQLDDSLEGLITAFAAHSPSFAFIHYSDPHEPYNSHGARRSEIEVKLDGILLGNLNGSDFDHREWTFDLSRGEHELSLSSEEEFTIRALDLFFGGDFFGSDEIDVEWTTGGQKQFLKQAVGKFEDSRWFSRATQLQIWANDRVADDEIEQRYAAELVYTDKYLGLLFEHLRAIGRYDDALIVFTSDHGEELWDHGGVGHVETLFDEVLHVPLAIKLPVNHPSRDLLDSRRLGLVRHIDLVPTMLDLLGLPPMPGMSGTSLLEGNPEWHLSETHRPEAERDLVSVRDAQFKMIYAPAEDRFELYDLDADPEEQTDVFGERSEARPAWPALLRKTASMGGRGSELSPAAREELEALGYF